MSKINIININRENAYSIVKESIYSCASQPIKLNDIKFHHNLHMESIPNAIKYGLLSKELIAKKIENRNLTEDELYKYSDECYVNGKDYISLASTEEDVTQMYDDEILYDTYKTDLSSIIISKEVKAFRNTTNYYNEFLVAETIPIELFNSLEIRLFKLLKKIVDNKENSSEESVKKIIEYYEMLRKIAIILKGNNLDIPLRESSSVMSNEESEKAITLDVEKVIDMPKLVLK